MRSLLCCILIAASFSACQNKNGDVSAKDSTASGSISSSSMTEKNKATAMASAQAMNAHDVDAMLKDVAPDMIDYGNGEAAPIKGKDSLAAMMKAMMAAFPDLKTDSMVTIAEGNKVAMFYSWSGTFKNPMMGMKPTNKMFRLRDVDLFTFNDSGKITSHRSVQSEAAMMSQLGISQK